MITRHAKECCPDLWATHKGFLLHEWRQWSMHMIHGCCLSCSVSVYSNNHALLQVTDAANI